jgi:hypothetical protein
MIQFIIAVCSNDVFIAKWECGIYHTELGKIHLETSYWFEGSETVDAGWKSLFEMEKRCGSF